MEALCSWFMIKLCKAAKIVAKVLVWVWAWGQEGAVATLELH